MTSRVHAEDFDWSWEKNVEAAEAPAAAGVKTAAAVEEKPAETAEVEETAEGLAPHEAFQWTQAKAESGERKAEDGGQGGKTQGSGVRVQEGRVQEGKGEEKREDARKYEALIRENQELKLKIADATREEKDARTESEHLTGEVRDLEKKIAAFAGKMAALQKERDAAGGDAAQIQALETKLAEVEKDKTKLAGELGRLKAERAKTPAKPAAAAVAAVPVQAPAGVKPGSDLFKDKERENALLKQKLFEVEVERQKTVKARDELRQKADKAEQNAQASIDRQKALEQQLAQTQTAQKETRRTIEKLMEQIPAMEKELVTLRKKTAKEPGADTKERALQALQIELEKREQRIIKAERMAELLDKTRQEVSSVDGREKRDMHYNMAVVYSKEGRTREAEQEYLKALRLDPNDAEVHYNLGILYDDELNDKAKAAMHYRKYIKINPHGGDVDSVKGWLMQIDMGK